MPRTKANHNPNKLCKCGNESAPNKTKCKKCHNEYMRNWRKDHPLNSEQRRKDGCRSYSHTMVKRGVLLKVPCACGEVKVVARHLDYGDPHTVVWLCENHSRALDAGTLPPGLLIKTKAWEHLPNHRHRRLSTKQEKDVTRGLVP